MKCQTKEKRTEENKVFERNGRRQEVGSSGGDGQEREAGAGVHSPIYLIFNFRSDVFIELCN